MSLRQPTSTTGDLQNNIEKLRHELLHCKYGGAIDVRSLRNGNPTDLLPFIHWALLGFSKFLHDDLAAKGHDLFTKTDMRFLEAVFKILRQEFDYQPQLRVDQFFVDGFVERKIILVCDILKLCQRRHLELKRDAKKHCGNHSSFSRPTSGARKAASPIRALVRNVASASVRSSGAESCDPLPLQPRIVVGDASAAARVVRVVAQDDDERGLPRPAAPPAPLPMTTSNLPPQAAVGARQQRRDRLTHFPATQSGFSDAEDAGGADGEAFGGDDDGFGVEEEDGRPAFAAIPISQGRAVATRVSAGLAERLGGGSVRGALAEVETVCRALQSKVEGMLQRVAALEARVGELDGVEEGGRRVEEECGARLLLAEGRLRYLEQRVQELEGSRGGEREAGEAQEVGVGGKGVREERVFVAVVGHKEGQGGAAGVSGHSVRGKAQIADHGMRREGGGGAGLDGDKENVQNSAWAREADGGAERELDGDARLNAFISGIQERFRQTKELLSEAETRAGGWGGVGVRKMEGKGRGMKDTDAAVLHVGGAELRAQG